MKWMVVLLFVGAVAIRVYATGEARFTGDEAEQWSTARRIATGEHFPIFGPAITGSVARLPGAGFYYFAAIPQLFGSSPRLGGLFIALFHVLAIFAIMRLATQARGPRAGLIFLALAAFAPWDVLYGDRVWSACVTPVAGTFAVYSAVKAHDDARWLAPLVFLLLIFPQLHLSAPICWVACAVILYSWPPVRWDKRWIAVGLLAAFLAYLGVLLSELQTGFANTRAILANSGGKEPLSYVMLSPLKSAIYAVLFGTADTAYNFEKGYWGGRFNELQAYFSVQGWKNAYAMHGAVVVLNVVSIALAVYGWIIAFVKIRERDLSAVLTRAVLASFFTAALLLVVSKKLFFPHYVDLLVPAALLPIALGIDRGWNKLAAPVLVASVLAMAAGTVRYYVEVDSLNGVSNTVEMVGAAVAEKRPVAVSFEGYANDYAWAQIARVHYKKPLLLDARSEIRYQIHNARRSDVLYERTVSRPPGLSSRASEDLTKLKIDAIDAAGKKSSCTPSLGNDRHVAEGGPALPGRDPSMGCRYGSQPWQELRAESFEIRGKQQLLLFMHPIAGGAVTAHVPVPEGVRRGVLRYGLSDSATRSDNRSPVEVRLSLDAREIGRGSAKNEPGLQLLPFVITATAATVSIEIQTLNDGARVFGFDIDFFDEFR
jgi:hypothetical protein